MLTPKALQLSLSMITVISLIAESLEVEKLSLKFPALIAS